MVYDPKIHHRRSIRLQNYDYSQCGMYFITICSKDQNTIFGSILDNEMILNEVGKIASEEWIRTAKLRPTIELDEFVIMPNHVHGILIIRDNLSDDDENNRPQVVEKFGKPTSNSIPTIIRGYKAAVTTRISYLRGITQGSIRQVGYYEEIIRSFSAYEKIREYIGNNPAHWVKDSL